MAKPHAGAEHRVLIQAMVERDPGLHLTEIAARAALSWHAAAYHVDILRDAGQVVIEKSGRDQRVFPRGIPARHRRWLAAMRVGQAKDILMVLLDDPRLTVAEIHRRVGRSEKAVRQRVTHLVKAGLVERTGTWRPVYEIKRSEARRIARLLFGQSRRARVGSWEWDGTRDRATLSKDGWRVWGLEQEAGGPDRSFLDLVHPEDRPGFEAAIAAAVADDRPHDLLVRIRTPRGERLVRHRGRVTARDAGGNAVRLNGTIEDVTERGEAERRRDGPPASGQKARAPRKPGEPEAPEPDAGWASHRHAWSGAGTLGPERGAASRQA